MAKKTKLKRTLGVFEVTIAGIGIILGAGIYALLGSAAGIAGNAMWLAFVIGAIVAGFTALSYAELSSIFPKAGAEYVYTKRTFGKRIAFLVNWLIIIGTAFSVATVSAGFGGYFKYFVEAPLFIVAGILIIIFTLLNIYGIRASVIAAAVATIIETIGLLIIIMIGLPYLGSVDYFEMPTPNISSLFLTASLLFFAFLGFEGITRLSEEVENPTKTIPTATLLSLGISTVIYVLVAIAAVSVLPWQQLATSDAPLAAIAESLFGSSAGAALAIIALFSTANTALLMMVSSSRLAYGMTDAGPLFKKLGAVHKTRRTPWVAAVFIGVLSLAAVSMADIEFLAYSADFTIFFTFTVVNLAAIWLHYREPNLHRPFSTPRLNGVPIVPIFGASSSVLLAITSGNLVIGFGIAFAAVGLILFEILRKMRLVTI